MFNADSSFFYSSQGIFEMDFFWRIQNEYKNYKN